MTSTQIATLATSEAKTAMLVIPPELLATIATQSPAELGGMILSIAVDRSMLPLLGVIESVRPDMVAIATPPILERTVAHEPDELAYEMPTVVSFASADRAFTITFVRFDGESATDAYVVVGGTVLHTRKAGSRAFDLFNRMD